MKQLFLAFVFLLSAKTFAGGIDPLYLRYTQFYHAMNTEQLRTAETKVGEQLTVLCSERHIVGELFDFASAFDCWRDVPWVIRGELMPGFPNRIFPAQILSDEIGWAVTKTLMKSGFRKEEYAYFLKVQQMNSKDASSLDDKIINEQAEKVIRAYSIRDELCRRGDKSFASFSCRNSLKKDPTAVNSNIPGKF